MNVHHSILMDGDDLARRKRGELAIRATALKSRGIEPTMAMLRVGDNPASAAYVGRKLQDCREVGITAREITLPADCSHETLHSEIDQLNANPDIHGVLVQLPLPGPLDDNHFVAAVRPDKDVDGLHPFNLGRLLIGAPTTLPCTPSGVLALLTEHGVPLAGKNVLVIGRGALVGRPLAMLLLAQGTDATVTIAHRMTENLADLARAADVIVSAAGQPDLVTAAMVKPGAAVVGVGITYDTQGRMVSDIATDVADIAGRVTPPHGSVGAMTRAFLLDNLLKLAERA